MNNLCIVMRFWDDCYPNSTRIRNVKFCWEQAKKVKNFLRENGVDVNATLYDFSETKVIDDAEHIPYPPQVYKLAEKTNIIINKNKDCSFLLFMDSDAFFDETDYNELLNEVKDLKAGDILTFDLAHLSSNIDEYIIDGKFYKDKSDYSYAYSGDKKFGPLAHGHRGSLGGVFLCDTNLLRSLNGFNEKYIGWGGEDGEMMSRINTSGIPHCVKSMKKFAPFHLPHFVDRSNPKYFDHDSYVKLNY